MKKKIQLLNKIAACGTDEFDRGAYEVGDGITDPDAIMVRSAATVSYTHLDVYKRQHLARAAARKHFGNAFRVGRYSSFIYRSLIHI